MQLKLAHEIFILNSSKLFIWCFRSLKRCFHAFTYIQVMKWKWWDMIFNNRIKQECVMKIFKLNSPLAALCGAFPLRSSSSPSIKMKSVWSLMTFDCWFHPRGFCGKGEFITCCWKYVKAFLSPEPAASFSYNSCKFMIISAIRIH